MQYKAPTIQEEIESLQSEIEKDINFLSLTRQMPVMPTWMFLGGIFGALAGIAGLLNILFTRRMHDEDHIINLIAIFVGGGFGLYTFLRERNRKQYIYRCEAEIKRKEEKLNLLKRIK